MQDHPAEWIGPASVILAVITFLLYLIRLTHSDARDDADRMRRRIKEQDAEIEALRRDNERMTRMLLRLNNGSDR